MGSRAEEMVRSIASAFAQGEPPHMPTLYAFVLSRLNSGVVAELTKEEKEHVRLALRGRRPQPQQCYKNAQTLAMDSDLIQYHEGYVMLDTIPCPIDHAWNTINGKIVDVTVRANNRLREREGIKLCEHSYCGIQIDKELIPETQLRTKHYSDVITHGSLDKELKEFQKKFPYLKNHLRSNTVVSLDSPREQS